ncbi:MAG: 6-phosphogluconate dehydrogenase [Bacteroidales bacterium]|nr:6-phosphogluconate dehydrogenase [Bacteroidales bacterium]
MKIVKRIIILALIVFLGICAFTYWGKYEEGVMAGKILRISQKGMIFKTYEGKLGLESFGALRGASPIAETFDFSVESKEKEVIKDLEAVALTGERVNLHYFKRYMSFPWRGNTKYFASRVERSKQ